MKRSLAGIVWISPKFRPCQPRTWTALSWPSLAARADPGQPALVDREPAERGLAGEWLERGIQRSGGGIEDDQVEAPDLGCRVVGRPDREPLALGVEQRLEDRDIADLERDGRPAGPTTSNGPADGSPDGSADGSMDGSREAAPRSEGEGALPGLDPPIEHELPLAQLPVEAISVRDERARPERGDAATRIHDRQPDVELREVGPDARRGIEEERHRMEVDGRCRARRACARRGAGRGRRGWLAGGAGA